MRLAPPNGGEQVEAVEPLVQHDQHLRRDRAQHLVGQGAGIGHARGELGVADGVGPTLAQRLMKVN